MKKTVENSGFKSDAQTPASDDSSPAETDAPDVEENETSNNEDSIANEGEPQLPPMPQSFRASSADPGPRGLRTCARHRASERQVQSSPGQMHGSESVPIEIDLTPKPVRRQLFPSPDKTQVRSDPGPTVAGKPAPFLPAFVRRSPRLNKTRDVFAMAPGAVAITVDGKENAAPSIAVMDDGLADLFEEGPAEVELPPMTPTPKRRSERLFLKTPSKTPSRQFGSDLSPNADLLPNFRTPKAKSGTHPALAALLGTVQKNVLDMTPFTRSIHDALTSDVHMPVNIPAEDPALTHSEAKNATPKKAIAFDFPDLPSLKNSSPMSSDQLLNFNFSEVTTDQLTSDYVDPFVNNAPMPSSPPAGLFSYLDPHHDTTMEAMWDEIIEADAGESSYRDPEAAEMNHSTQPLRRSPRRQRVS